MAEDCARKMTYNWTDEDVENLIRLRMAKDGLFSGSRFASAAGWEAVIQEMGLTHLISPAIAAKKWKNLKETFEELIRPPTGSGTEAEEPLAASWKWYSLMDEAIGSKPSVRPPYLIASCWENPYTSSASVPQDQELTGEKKDEEKPRPAKRPRRDSLFSLLEKIDRREEEWARREEERAIREEERAIREEERAIREEERAIRQEERDERLLNLLEKVVEKM